MLFLHNVCVFGHPDRTRPLHWSQLVHIVMCHPRPRLHLFDTTIEKLWLAAFVWPNFFPQYAIYTVFAIYNYPNIQHYVNTMVWIIETMYVIDIWTFIKKKLIYDHELS